MLLILHSNGEDLEVFAGEPREILSSQYGSDRRYSILDQVYCIATVTYCSVANMLTYVNDGLTSLASSKIPKLELPTVLILADEIIVSAESRKHSSMPVD